MDNMNESRILCDYFCAQRKNRLILTLERLKIEKCKRCQIQGVKNKVLRKGWLEKNKFWKNPLQQESYA